MNRPAYRRALVCDRHGVVQIVCLRMRTGGRFTVSSVALSGLKSLVANARSRPSPILGLLLVSSGNVYGVAACDAWTWRGGLF
jgi:hypothetical protein